jgi:hypothetical protein
MKTWARATQKINLNFKVLKMKLLKLFKMQWNKEPNIFYKIKHWRAIDLSMIWMKPLQF